MLDAFIRPQNLPNAKVIAKTFDNLITFPGLN